LLALLNKPSLQRFNLICFFFDTFEALSEHLSLLILSFNNLSESEALISQGGFNNELLIYSSLELKVSQSKGAILLVFELNLLLEPLNL
jgi:hypothetical protein